MRKLLVVLLLAMPLTACRSTSSSGQAEGASITLPRGMSVVTDPSRVCMVNDRFMGVPQIPVSVEGRTYYGCCPQCKDRLGNEPATRTARDPVTGQEVDKARAVIVQDENGAVLYFASEDTLRRFRS